MRIAVIADVHGNLPALEAVLEDSARLAVDRIVINGDFANRGPNSVEVYQRLGGLLSDATLGNHDDLMVMFTRRQGAKRDAWLDDPFWAGGALAASRLADAGAIETIEALPMTIRIELPGAPSLLISHGSPRHYREGYGQNMTPELISEITEQYPADVLVGSHTHRPYLTRWGRYTVMNTGAVGAPFNADPRAHYLVLTLVGGQWQPEFRRVPYDLDAAVTAYQGNGTLEQGGLDTLIFREELKHARSFLVPYLMWCEEEGRARDLADWREYVKRFGDRFQLPERPAGVRSSAQP